MSADSLNHLPGFDNRNSHCRRVLGVAANEEAHICFSPPLRYRAGHFDRVGECNARDASMVGLLGDDATPFLVIFVAVSAIPLLVIEITSEITLEN